MQEKDYCKSFQRRQEALMQWAKTFCPVWNWYCDFRGFEAIISQIVDSWSWFLIEKWKVFQTAKQIICFWLSMMFFAEDLIYYWHANSFHASRELWFKLNFLQFPPLLIFQVFHHGSGFNINYFYLSSMFDLVLNWSKIVHDAVFTTNRRYFSLLQMEIIIAT